eukprot:Clim_evm49s147 gene=Clim_evmTU49s147
MTVASPAKRKRSVSPKRRRTTSPKKASAKSTPLGQKTDLSKKLTPSKVLAAVQAWSADTENQQITTATSTTGATELKGALAEADLNFDAVQSYKRRYLETKCELGSEMSKHALTTSVLQEKITEVKNDLSHRDFETYKLKDELDEAYDLIDRLKSGLEQTKTTLESTKNKLESATEAEKETSGQAEMDRQACAETKAELAEAKSNALEQLHLHESELSARDQTISDLRRELAEKSICSEELADKTAALEKSMEDVLDLRAKVDTLTSERDAQLFKLQNMSTSEQAVDEARIMAATYIKGQKEKEQLEEEISKLRMRAKKYAEDNHRVEAAESEKKVLEDRLNSAVQDNQRLQSQVSTLENWTVQSTMGIDGQTVTFKEPGQLQKFISDIRSAVLERDDEIGQLKQKLASVEKNDITSKLRIEVDDLKRQLDQEHISRKQLESRLVYSDTSVKRLKEALALGLQAGDVDGGDESKTTDLIDTINELRKQHDFAIDQYKKDTDFYQREAENLRKSYADVDMAKRRLESRVVQAEEEITRIVSEKKLLQEELQSKHGATSAPRQEQSAQRPYKILHFQGNPLDMALRKRLNRVTELQAQLEFNSAATPPETTSAPAKSEGEMQSTKELKDQLEQANIRNERMRTIFAKKTNEFRRDVSEIFGWRVEMPTERRYRLTPIALNDSTKYLLFEYRGRRGGDAPGFYMLETTYASDPLVQSLMETYLGTLQSIPAFLAAVNLQLFNRL